MGFFLVVFILIMVGFFIHGLWTMDATFNVFIKTRFMGYKKIEIKNTAPFYGNNYSTITKDFKEAPLYPLFPKIGTLILNEDGTARYEELSFNSFTWKSV